ncbi:DUF397 domain-containing protein [Streptomyces sp. BSE7F]|nr:DUF397 domain-containing protein [Streptomyces sp. BSE7F]
MAGGAGRPSGGLLPPADATRCAISWTTASSGGRCRRTSRVEVAVTEQAIRDSKDMTRPHIVVGRDGWSRFVGFAAEA